MSRIKMMTSDAMLRNICGLSKGDRAYCGPYGTVECYQAASENKAGVRKFKVSGNANGKLANRGNWNYTSLREAICG